MSRRPNGSDGPEDVDAAFAEIVAGLEQEGLGVGVADEDELREHAERPERADRGEGAERAEQQTGTAEPSGEPTGWRTSEVEWDSVTSAEQEHFVPPEPPPLPRLRPGTIFGIFLLLVGVLLLAGPQVIGLAPRIGTPLGLVALAAGVGWLVLRMRQGPPPDSGWDNGAQL